MRPFLFLLILFAVSTGVSQTRELPFYAFQNGVRKATDEQRADLLATLGYDGIGSAHLPSEGDVETVFETYRNRGLRVFSFYTGATLGDDGVSLPPELLSSIPAMKDRDVSLEFFVKGKKDRAPERDPELVEVIREVADIAQESGVSIVLYPHTGMYVETLEDATRIAKKVDRENVGVMFNLCHFLRVEPEKDLRTLLQNAAPLLRQVSISGADRGGSDWKSLIQPLGSGSYEVAGLLKILHELKFRGPVGLQCFNIEGRSEVFLAESVKAWTEMKRALP